MNLRIDQPASICRATIKSRIEELAILGGRAGFTEPLHVGRPNVVGKARIMSRISQILESHWLTNDGEVLQAFEREVAEYAQVQHCVAVCNGTLALQLAMRALDVCGEVIVPALTFVATPHAVEWAGTSTVFADVDRTHWTLDPADVLRRISPRTTAIVGVHLWGQTCAVQSLTDLAAEFDLKLMFDASHALGCTHEGVAVGNFGSCETLSFHATKFVNAAEGGAILTNDSNLAERLRWLRNFGFSDPGHVEFIGTNAKMSEISAAIGLTSLEHADRIIDLNLDNHHQYVSEFEGIPGVSIREFNSGAERHATTSIWWPKLMPTKPDCHVTK